MYVDIQQGQTPVSLAESTPVTSSDQTFYDLSLVDRHRVTLSRGEQSLIAGDTSKPDELYLYW